MKYLQYLPKNDQEWIFALFIALGVVILVIVISNSILSSVVRRRDKKRAEELERQKYHAEEIRKKTKPYLPMPDFIGLGGVFGGTPFTPNGIYTGTAAAQAAAMFQLFASQKKCEVVSVTKVEEPPKPEVRRIRSREYTGYAVRGVNSDRIVTISLTEEWSDGVKESKIYSQKGVFGPWFDMATGECVDDDMIRRLDAQERYERKKRNTPPSPEAIFRALVRDISIPKGIPYSGSGSSVQLPPPKENPK